MPAHALYGTKSRPHNVSVRRGICGIATRVLLVAFAAAGAASAESNHKVLGLSVTTETAPVGGTAHVKVFLAAPQPIANGYMFFTFEDGSGRRLPTEVGFLGATAFSAAGDASGQVRVSGNFDRPDQGVFVSFSSPSGGLGRLRDMPLVELDLTVHSELVIAVLLAWLPANNNGYQLPTRFSDLEGRTYDLVPEAIQPGGVKVAGTLSVEDVTQGWGILPAGSVLQIHGTGFTPETIVLIEGVSIAATNFISPTAMTVELLGDTEMTGKHILVRNPDGVQVDSWAGFRGGLIFPLMSTTTTTWVVRQTAPMWGAYLGVQNPNPLPAKITVSDSLTPAFTIPGWGAAEVNEGPGFQPGPPLTHVINSSVPVRLVGEDVCAGNLDTVACKNPYTIEFTGPQKPLMGSVVNAASMTQRAISPGEIVTIFGVAEGPSNPATFTLDGNGKVASNLSGVRVLFDGAPAPILYASASQVNAIVPYEVDGKGVTTMKVEYNGTQASAWGVAVSPAAPAIFTLDSSGQGQAAVLNEDNSVNGPSNPAARGSVIQIYATGEGQTAPPGVTGSVTHADAKKPLLGVSVTIDGLNATLVYAGSAPESVAGLFQVNATIPAGVKPGPTVPIILTVGSALSPDGVTIAIK
jgi:uncharacterized protein (TIGR03437 family)